MTQSGPFPKKRWETPPVWNPPRLSSSQDLCPKLSQVPLRSWTVPTLSFLSFPFWTSLPPFSTLRGFPWFFFCVCFPFLSQAQQKLSGDSSGVSEYRFGCHSRGKWHSERGSEKPLKTSENRDPLRDPLRGRFPSQNLSGLLPLFLLLVKVPISSGFPLGNSVAPYRAILRYYRCDTPYCAILLKGG